ncbi:MAG: HK97 family phage prohead protease [Armatimonadota bacterium]
MQLQYKSFEFKAAGEGLADGEFAGYGSVFKVVDTYGDIMGPGAFSKTLDFFLENGQVQWQHRMSQPIGKPIEAREDAKGLWVKGKISDTAMGRDALTLVRDGVVRKLSIGFVTKGYEVLSESRAREILGDAGYEEAIKALPWWVDELRLITEVKLYEVSLVSFPANEQAEIVSVKAAPDGRLPETERQLERFLRDAGFSRKAAVAIASHGFKGLQRDAAGEREDDTNGVLDALKRAELALQAS